MHRYINTLNGIPQSHKKKKRKNEILPFATTLMHLEGILLSETSQTEEDKYCVIFHTCGI